MWMWPESKNCRDGSVSSPQHKFVGPDILIALYVFALCKV